MPTSRELGIGLVPYSPLGRGFLTGQDPLARRLRGRRLPAQTRASRRENFERNLGLVGASRRSQRRGASPPAQLALAWLLAGRGRRPDPRDEASAPTSRRTSAALEVELSDEDLARLAAALPVAAGERYESAA